VHAENMSRMLPMYRRGLMVDYPTDARRKAGSCIFIHVWSSPRTGTAGCVALPEPRVVALQSFAQGGAVLAILPLMALERLRGCLPQL
jgi:D-alanyl-D-alanine dipeptidase